ncbi:MAG TPA: hypothetical protein VFU15_17055 [Bacteroidia bacterium]|nr:hypothetical protein [Bacteroidia bacterium]
MIRPFFILAFFLSAKILSAQDTLHGDTALFEKMYAKLQHQVDQYHTAEERDSLTALQDSLLVMFFNDSSTFNYHFSFCNAIRYAGDLQVMTMEDNTDGPFRSVTTCMRYRGESGAIHFTMLDGAVTEEEQDNFLCTGVYCLNREQKIYLVTGTGMSCNSCPFACARTYEISGDDLVEYPAFAGSSVLSMSWNGKDCNAGVTYDETGKELTLSYCDVIPGGSGKQQQYTDRYRFGVIVFVKEGK